MVTVLLPPERLNHLLGRFRNVLSKPQFENFRSYRITKTVPSMEFVITWVRKKSRQGFIHYIWDKLKQGIPIRSLIMTVGKIDTVYI
jgi:hypothetical protein